MFNKSKISLLLATTLIAPVAVAQELDASIYATINGDPLTYDTINLIMGSNDLPQDQMQDLLQRVVSNFVIAQKATELGLDDNERVQQELKLAKIQVLARNYLNDIIEKNQVTDEDIQARFDQTVAEQPSAKEYKVSHILIEDADEAKELMNDIDEDFDTFKEVAAEKSIDPGSGQNGGDLGWAVAETYVPPFAEAIKNLQPGEFTDELVKSQFGWHIIYLEDSRDFEIPPMNDQQKQQILESIHNEIVVAEIGKLVADADIVINSANK